MDPRMIPRGGSKEEYNYDPNAGGPGRANEPGLYHLPGTDKFIETFGVQKPDGSMTYAQTTGKLQADGFTQIGFRPASEEDAKAYRAQQENRAKARRIAESRTTTSMGSANERK